MRKLSLLIVLFLGLSGLHSLVVENANLMNFFFGAEPNCEYDKWESHIVEGIASEGYNMYAPYDRQTDGFGQFTVPSEEQTLAWEEAVDYFFAGEYENAQTTFDTNNIPYTVVKFIEGNIIYYMLRENLNLDYHDDNGTAATYDDEHGSFDLGWGIFVYKLVNTNPVVVTAPHPNDDFISPYFAFKAFKELNAQYLMINGTGREVLWTGYDGYQNGKSLCDPTRNSSLPFNYFYKKACDQIREDFDRRELSVQIHSYDWDTHPGRASCQISPGQSNRPAGLPIRDFSSLQQDVIQNTNYVVIPQGTIGDNREVTIRDYYSVWSNEFDTIYQDTLIVRDDVDLPGFGGSFHEQYSTANFNKFDVFSPFFHVEFAELPSCFPQDEETFKWLYGYNSYTGMWNLAHRYSRIEQYYQPFINSLKLAVEAWVELDDGVVPETPTNLRIAYEQGGNSLGWDITPCYDFYSYELLYATNPLSQGNYTVVNRDSDSQYERLAFPKNNYVKILDLPMNQNCYAAIRTVDYNGNVSEFSEEFNFTTLPAVTSLYKITASDDNMRISWRMEQHQNCAGFDLYRSVNYGEAELYSSYTNNSSLVIGASPWHNYTFYDNNVQLDNIYNYHVEVVTNAGVSHLISPTMEAVITEYKFLKISNITGNESITFGKNIFATSEYDEVYDQSSNQELFAWIEDGKQMKRNIIAEFDPTTDYQYLNFFVDTVQPSHNFYIDTNRHSERFYIEHNDNLYSLSSIPTTINFPETGRRYARLVWGNLQAKVRFPELDNYVAYQGDTIDLVWQADYPQLISSFDLYLKNESDSLLIASSLSSQQTTFQLENNYDQDYRLIDFVVRVHSIDGEILDFTSNHKLVLKSQIEPLSISTEESNQLFAYPFALHYDISHLSDAIQSYSFADGVFSENYMLDSNHSFFFSTTNDAEWNPLGIPIMEDTQYPLNNGWNLIRNVHPLDYPLKDILFDRNNDERNFKFMQESGAILPVVMGIRDGSYTPIDMLKAYESAFLYKLDNQPLSIRFKPNNVGQDIHEVEAELFFTLEFKTSNGAKDEITIGYQSGLTPVIDNYYEFPKPPLRPTFGLTEAYIVSEPPLSNFFPKMHTKLSVAPPNENQTWDVAFTNSLNEPVQVRIKTTNSVADYAVTLHHNGNPYRLSEEFITLPNTSQSGTYEAQVTLFNATDNSDNDVVPLTNFTVSPNPVREFANFSVKNNRSSKFDITIYNIRGQKVKTIKVTDCKDANSSISWNLTNDNNKRVSSGIYFVKYQSGEHKELRKICVMK